jgi:hypothetical protein
MGPDETGAAMQSLEVSHVIEVTLLMLLTYPPVTRMRFLDSKGNECGLVNALASPMWTCKVLVGWTTIDRLRATDVSSFSNCE